MKKKAETTERKNGLFFAVGIVLVLAIVLTWLIKGGSFQGSEFAIADYTRLGLHDIFTIPFYSIYYFVIQVTLLIAIAIFYGVVSKTKGYKTLVSGIAKILEGKGKNGKLIGSIIFAVIVSFIVTIITAFSSQWLIVLIFMPLIISICAEMKMDKIAAFAISFGSILVGIIGAIFGTEVLTFFTYYAGSNLKDLMFVKILILVLSFLIFNALTIIRLVITTTKNKELVFTDPLANEVETKKNSSWPLIVTFALVAIILVLGFVDWNNFHETKIFTDLLTKINEVHFGKDFYLFKYLLGNVQAFGAFNLEASIVILAVSTLISAIIYGVKTDAFFENAIDGIKAFIKPIALVVLCYCVFVVVYMCPFIPTIIDSTMDANSKLAPFLVSISGMIASIFNVDYGYTAYTIAPYFASLYPKDVSAVSLVLTSIYGLCMFIFPTSIGLVYGLQYIGISYKSWLKHIWIFALAMFAILQVIYFIIL